MTKKIAAIFPGQGSQAIGMLKELAEHFPSVEKTFIEASDILNDDLWELVQNGPEARLNQTEFTQPALLAASVAIFTTLEETKNLPPIAAMAGHSLGEYSALVCADALGFQDALRLVSLRGQLMQQACAEGKGAMAAIIGLADEVVESLCVEVSTPENNAAIANYNSHGQVVIAGHTDAVLALIEKAKTQKAKIAKLLPVSVPSHSILMRGAANQLAKALAEFEFQAPKIPILHNINTATTSDPAQIKQWLIEQLYSPVQWTHTQEKLAQMGITHFLEIGPGKILTGLAKRTVPTVSCLPINQVHSFNELRELIEVVA